MNDKEYILHKISCVLDCDLKKLNTEDKIEVLNNIKQKLHELSPFKNEPVDCVLWVKNEKVKANSYNPNNVAIPEMELLKLSIELDGFTQPIVSMEEDNDFIVVDGFHRNRVGKEDEVVKNRLLGYLPIVEIRKSQSDLDNRIASTIRHNRARGKHQVAIMSDIVSDLRKRGWSCEKIGKNLGMDQDEVLRLSQISGLMELFADKDFSQAWEADEIYEDNLIEEQDE